MRPFLRERFAEERSLRDRAAWFRPSRVASSDSVVSIKNAFEKAFGRKVGNAAYASNFSNMPAFAGTAKLWPTINSRNAISSHGREAFAPSIMMCVVSPLVVIV
jgi:hypothetical protein